MTAITDARAFIQDEDVKFRASVSEAVGNKLGGSINFINNRQNDTHSWNLNGPYKRGEGSQGTDGYFHCIFDMEITGFAYTSTKSGTSGTTSIDIHLLDGAGGDFGTIFSTLPSVDSTSADFSSTIYDVINSTTISNPTGHTLAVLMQTQFSAGDILRLDLDSGMFDANNFQFVIYFRPV
jgi:hypothetical protein